MRKANACLFIEIPSSAIVSYEPMQRTMTVFFAESVLIVFGAVKDRPVAFDPVLAIGIAILHEITEGDRPLFQLFDEMDERTVDLFHLVIVQDVDRTDIHQRIRQHLHAFAMDDVRFLHRQLDKARVQPVIVHQIVLDDLEKHREVMDVVAGLDGKQHAEEHIPVIILSLIHT